MSTTTVSDALAEPEQPADNRPRTTIPIGKKINLAQLSAEVGTALCASMTEVVVADPAAKVTATALTAAIANHVPPPAPAPAQPLTDAEILAVRTLLSKNL